MAETQEASVLTSQEFHVMKEMADGEGLEGYLDFYSILISYIRVLWILTDWQIRYFNSTANKV
jgi:hypothetical protein